MTIEELRALIATPMKNEAVKQAYLFSCFYGLRIRDIIGLKWGNVYVDNGQYWLEVVMQKTIFLSRLVPMMMTTRLTLIKLQEHGRLHSLRGGVSIMMGHEMNGLIHIQQ